MFYFETTQLKWSVESNMNMRVKENEKERNRLSTRASARAGFENKKEQNWNKERKITLTTYWAYVLYFTSS